MLTETLIEDPRWQAIALPPLAERAARAVLTHLGLDPDGFELAVLAADDARLATLNGAFRGKPQPTNVLSWPSAERGAARPGGAPRRPDPALEAELGDIALGFETCQAEADAAGLPLEHHAAHLMVHAVLHLLGYDHERDDDAALMEQAEIAILAGMGVSNPYAGQIPSPPLIGELKRYE